MSLKASTSSPRQRVEVDLRPHHRVQRPPKSASSIARQTRLEVKTARGVETGLPRHILAAFETMSKQLDILHAMYRRINTFNQSELYSVAAKGQALFESQRSILSDTRRACEHEINFLNGKLRDANAINDYDVFSSPQERSALVGWQCAYSMITSTARMCNADYASVLVRNDNDRDRATSTSGGEEGQENLSLVIFVSASPLNPATQNYSLPADVAQVCENVIHARCAVNIRVPNPRDRNFGSSQIDKRTFQTLLACPILVPQNDSLVLGVVVIANKKLSPIAAPDQQSRMFTHADEGRLMHCAENLAEVFTAFKLIKPGQPPIISPSYWENVWTLGTRESAVLSSAFRDQPGRGFVYRDDGNVVTSYVRDLEHSKVRQRNMITHKDHLQDLLAQVSELEEKLQESLRQIGEMERAKGDLERALQAEKEGRALALHNAESMRMLSERLLRSAFVSPRELQDIASSLSITQDMLVPSSTFSPAGSSPDLPSLTRDISNVCPPLRRGLGPQSSRMTKLA